MVDRTDDATCLLGLEGLAVERVVLTGLGVKIVQLVTDDPDAARCPGCRVLSSSGKDWSRGSIVVFSRVKPGCDNNSVVAGADRLV